MKYGVNTWVWTSPLTTQVLKELAPKVKSLGFDWIETPLESLDDLDFDEAAAVIKENDLLVSAFIIQMKLSTANLLSNRSQFCNRPENGRRHSGCRCFSPPPFRSRPRSGWDCPDSEGRVSTGCDRSRPGACNRMDAKRSGPENRTSRGLFSALNLCSSTIMRCEKYLADRKPTP